MKRIMLVVLLGLAATVHAQEIEFRADINEMSPLAYSSRTGLTGFSFEMRNDSAIVHLPYMGQVYNPTFSNDGLNFSGHCSKLTVKPTKKNSGKVVSFSMKHDIVTFQFKVTLWDNYRIDIYMKPSNAQSCNYMGYWESPVEGQ